ncbi:MAG: class I tRNA ligase family protein [Polyangiaceae bacterium]
MEHPKGPPADVASVLQQIRRPKRALVTAGMPYANGPLHLGHLAGAHLPADIYSRWMRMLIGGDNVLYVCGSDEHGSTSEIAAIKAGVTIREHVDSIQRAHKATLGRYSISLDTFSGTSQPECFPIHKQLAHELIVHLQENGLLSKRATRQWFDPVMNRFLPDRYVQGRCPNPKCDNESAYSDECDRCGSTYDPSELKSPRSTLSNGTPELRETVHFWLDMWKVAETLRVWISGKEKTWRRAVLSEVLETVMPSLCFDKAHEPAYKELKASLPDHKMKYTPKKEVVLQFKNRPDLEKGLAFLAEKGISSNVLSGWAHRSITRDIAWGIPITEDPELAGKTLYVWPDSLIAPISFSQVALKQRGEDPARHVEWWNDPEARVVQFLGQDNVYFYVLMQGAMWLGQQADPHRLPIKGELQLTDVIGCFHLLVGGEKMSKSRGNFYTGDQLLDEKGYTVDQIRYYLALLSLAEKPSDFDFAKLDDRNKFLAGPMNAAFERPISAAHSKFGGKVPEGVLIEKVVADTVRIVQRFVKSMERADYPNLLFEIENYARIVNSLFTQYKPHDDRHPEEGRKNALYTAFYVLKNLMIMLSPFVPDTMDRLRQSLNLPPEVICVDELGKPIPAGHELGQKLPYFPTPPGAEAPST